MKALGLTANALAKAIGVPPNRITAVLKDERGITGDTGIRLRRFFKTSAEFRLNFANDLRLRNAEKALPGWMAVWAASKSCSAFPQRDRHPARKTKVACLQPGNVVT